MKTQSGVILETKMMFGRVWSQEKKSLSWWVWETFYRSSKNLLRPALTVTEDKQKISACQDSQATCRDCGRDWHKLEQVQERAVCQKYQAAGSIPDKIATLSRQEGLLSVGVYIPALMSHH